MEQQCYSFWRIFQTFQSNTERQTVVTLTTNVVLNKRYLRTTKTRSSRRTSNASKWDIDTSTWPTWKGGQPHPQLARMQVEEASPHPPPTRGAKAKLRRGNCQRHRAMRRGLGCNLILNHIHCRNQSDTHNPKNPKSKPNRNRIIEREVAHRNGEGRSTKVASQIAPTARQSTRKNTSPLPSTQHTTTKSTPPPWNGIEHTPLVGVRDGEERVRRSTTSGSKIVSGATGKD